MQKSLLHGLIIDSEPDLRAIPVDTQITDLTVRLSDKILSLKNPPLEINQEFAWNHEQCVALTDCAPRYLVSKGETIEIEKIGYSPLIHPSLRDLSIGCALVQRGDLVIHASGIVSNEGVELILGRSGCGKSTYAAALALAGKGMFLTDDIARLHLLNDEVVSSFGAPECFLSTQSIELLTPPSDAIDSRLYRVLDSKKRVFFPCSIDRRFIPVTKISYLSSSETTPGSAFDTAEAIQKVYESLLLLPLFESFHGKKHFDIVTKLLHQTKIYAIQQKTPLPR